MPSRSISAAQLSGKRWAALPHCEPTQPVSAYLTDGITFVILTTMKTAISLPDPLFQAAEEFAHEQGWSRSELYARALQAYLQAHRYHGVTDTLNQIYATEPSLLDPAVAAAQARVLPSDEW